MIFDFFFIWQELLSSDLDEISNRLVMKAKQSGEWFNLEEAVTWVDTLGDQPVRDRLKHLVDIGVLETEGRTKGLKIRFKIHFAKTIEAFQTLDRDEP